MPRSLSSPDSLRHRLSGDQPDKTKLQAPSPLFEFSQIVLPKGLAPPITFWKTLTYASSGPLNIMTCPISSELLFGLGLTFAFLECDPFIIFTYK